MKGFGPFNRVDEAKKLIDSKEADMPPEISEDELENLEIEQSEITERIERRKEEEKGISGIIRHPIRFARENPINTFIFSIPAAFLFLIIGIIFIIARWGIAGLWSTTFIDNVIIWAIIICMIPVAAVDYYEGRRIKSLEEGLPNFFRDVAGMHDSGMTLPNAIHIVSESEYGSLTPFVRKIDSEMSWNATFVDSMERFGKNVSTPLAKRSVNLISQATSAGGNVSEILRAAAYDTYEHVSLVNERKNNMLIYTIIVIVAFLVFIFVILMLTTSFLNTMAEAGKAVMSSGSAAADSGFIGSVDMDAYNRLFMHAAVIQGLFSGFVAGQMGEGRVLGGLKYSCMMMIIAWTAFVFFV